MWSNDAGSNSISGPTCAGVNWQTCARTPSPHFRAAAKTCRASSMVKAPRSTNTSTNCASFRRAAVGTISSQIARRYSPRLSLNSAGTMCAPSSVGTSVPGHDALTTFNASSDFNSPSTFSAYPDFASTVVVPCAAISRSADNTISASAARGAFRTAAMLAPIPPPADAISSYVAPAIRFSKSINLGAANTGCVCESTNPGSTTPPPQSISRTSRLRDCSQRSRMASRRVPAETIFPAAHSTAAS